MYRQVSMRTAIWLHISQDIILEIVKHDDLVQCHIKATRSSFAAWMRVRGSSWNTPQQAFNVHAPTTVKMFEMFSKGLNRNNRDQLIQIRSYKYYFIFLMLLEKYDLAMD